MKKRITRKEWEYIDKYNPAAKWLRPFASYSLVEIEDGFCRECKVSWPVYLALFIPCHLAQALYCMWSGGLKEFYIEGRSIGYDNIHETWGKNKGIYPKAKEIWDKH